MRMRERQTERREGKWTRLDTSQLSEAKKNKAAVMSGVLSVSSLLTKIWVS